MCQTLVKPTCVKAQRNIKTRSLFGKVAECPADLDKVLKGQAKKGDTIMRGKVDGTHIMGIVRCGSTKRSC